MAKILFIGGTGIISSACAPRAIAQGHELYLFNRGLSFRKPAEGAHVVSGNIHEDGEQLRAFVKQNQIDVVVNWIAFHPKDVQRDIDLLNGLVKQYVFISSASAYQKPVKKLPITEETPLENPYWEYSRNKKACEELLLAAHRERGFPATIVRPSHTYDKTLLPFSGRYTMLGRMLQGKPVVIHGDGTSLWVMTHHVDFAKGFVGLLGNPGAIGEIFHITSDEVLTWNAIYAEIATAAGAELHAVHVPSDVLARYDADLGASLLGDKAHSVTFDNAKIKRLVPDYAATIPFSQGAKEVTAWYAANPEYQKIDPAFDALLDRVIGDMSGVGKAL
jgi:nucleoside-diphosphate-sugar epimerase